MAKDNHLVTGQFVRIEQTPAKSSLRFWGFFIDLLMEIAYIYAVFFVTDTLNINMEASSVLLFVVLPVLIYQPVCEVVSGGQTLGKFLLNTRVVRVDGSSPSVGDFLLRWLLFSVDILFFGAVAAGTMVIRLNTYDKIRVSLDEFRFVKEDYHPSYEEARNLTVEQADRIARTLADRSTSRRHRIETLARQMYHELLLSGEIVDPEVFLTTLLSDYRYYDLNSV
jgi:uncharacterized RDD family membrane protein YckC